MRLGRTVSGVVIVAILAGIGKGLYSGWPTPSPLAVAYAECRPCGLTHAEVDKIIDDVRHATLTRAQNRELFIATLCVQIRQACSAGASPVGKGTRFPYP